MMGKDIKRFFDHHLLIIPRSVKTYIIHRRNDQYHQTYYFKLLLPNPSDHFRIIQKKPWRKSKRKSKLLFLSEFDTIWMLDAFITEGPFRSHGHVFIYFKLLPVLLSRKDQKKVDKLAAQIPYHEGRGNLEEVTKIKDQIDTIWQKAKEAAYE